MEPSDPLRGALAFLAAAERLKDTLRSAHTALGRRESVAEHSWRLALMAIVFADRMPGVDLLRLLKIIIIHDLGEAVRGDIPAVEQNPAQSKSGEERADFTSLLATLDAGLRTEFLALWDDYDLAGSPEARLAKGLDKLETIFQHNIGRNPADFDYAFNLGYGADRTRGHALLEALRRLADEGTRGRMAESNGQASVDRSGTARLGPQ